MKRPLIIALLVATVLIAGAATLAWATGWDGPDRDRTQTIRIVTADGSALPPDTTVIVNADRDWRPGFPFGLFFFPFFVILGIFLVSRLVSGGHGWRGPHGPGGPGGPPPAWFEQMHAHSHEADWTKPANHQAPNEAG
jgi:hypothetical protein